MVILFDYVHCWHASILLQLTEAAALPSLYSLSFVYVYLAALLLLL